MKKKEVEKYLHKKVKEGETVSPVLPEGVKNYLIDIDGTICDDVPNEEPERMGTAKFYPDALETINGWYDEGHIICFFTARFELCLEVNAGGEQIIFDAGTGTASSNCSTTWSEVIPSDSA